MASAEICSSLSSASRNGWPERTPAATQRAVTSLCVRAPPKGADGAAEGARPLDVLRAAALEEVDEWPAEHQEAWKTWLASYYDKVAAEARPEAERLAEMREANPKFILRGWMAKEAYDAAARGDCSVL